MSQVTVIIAVKDNPLHINDCIRSIEKFAAEIIIADIGIAPDLKHTLLQNKAVRVITIEKPVPYIEVIREELKKTAAHDYILFLDPDEILPQTLLDALTNKTADYDYVSIPRKNLIFGKWIENSRWWPDYQIRFFKKNSVFWPIQIHAQPKVSGKELKLDAKEKMAIIHHNYESIDEFMQKLVRYTKAEAAEKIQQNRDFTLQEAMQLSLSEFIGRYFAGKGYKDGMHGFVLAIMQMFYYFLVYFYYWEQKKYQHKEASEAVVYMRQFFFNGLFESNFWMMKEKLNGQISSVKLKLQNIFLKHSS